jgi:hypothetical protein
MAISLAAADDAADAPSTPPTVCDAWEIHSDFAKIWQQWDRLLALCDDEATFGKQVDAVSAWSVGKQVGHLALVNNEIADEIFTRAARAAIARGASASAIRADPPTRALPPST